MFNIVFVSNNKVIKKASINSVRTGVVMAYTSRIAHKISHDLALILDENRKVVAARYAVREQDGEPWEYFSSGKEQDINTWLTATDPAADVKQPPDDDTTKEYTLNFIGSAVLIQSTRHCDSYNPAHAALSAMYRIRPKYAKRLCLYDDREKLVAEYSTHDQEITSHMENISFTYILTLSKYSDKSRTQQTGYLTMRMVWDNISRAIEDYKQEYGSYPDCYTITVKGLDHDTGYSCSVDIAAFSHGFYMEGTYYDITCRQEKRIKGSR